MAAIDNQIGNVKQELANVAFRIQQLQAEIQTLTNAVDRSIARGDNSLARSQSESLAKAQEDLSRAVTFQQQKEQELARLEAQKLAEQKQVVAPSAGATVQQGQTAKDDGANTQEPEKFPPQVVQPDGRIQNAQVVRPTNVSPPSTQVNDQNTNPQPPKTLQNTQAKNANQPAGAISTSEYIVAPEANGVGSRTDDNIDSVGANNTTVQEVNSLFGNQYIEPQPNELKKYGSYTYSLSWYLMGPADYNELVETGRVTLNDAQLLVQSGGIGDTGSVTVTVNGQTGTALSRNPFFNLDYYLDDLELKSLFAGRGTNAGHNVTELSFTVREPNGLTLQDNLYNAIVDFNKVNNNKNTNYAAQQYLMVIRFYGYDENGMPQTASGGAVGGAVQTSPNAVIKKYIPFIIKNISFVLQDTAVTYKVEAAAVPYEVAAGSIRGSVPFTIELSGDDVKTLLGGSGTVTVGAGLPGTADGRETTPSAPGTTGTGASGFPINSTIANNTGPEKADAAPKKQLKRGLMEALNSFQQELVRRGVYTVADVYKVEFANPSLANSKVRKQGQLNKNAVPFAAASTTAQGKLPDKVTPDVENRIFNVTQGTQIVQVIDQIVRMSQFIDDQARFTVDEETGQLKENTGTKTPAWYKINLKTKSLGYDTKRNDYAYEMTFVISLYGIQSLQSVYFQSPTFRGVHKRYPYWWTGQNTEVLKFEQAYNKLWYQILEGNKILDQETSSAAAMREMPKRAFLTASNQSSQGAARGANEPGANAADYLYSPADQGSVRMTIVGDPAWIQQSEFTKGASPNTFDFNPFLPDGTINTDAQQVLFEIAFAKPGDYDNTTGLLTPAGTEQSFVYFCKTVSSRFSQGGFTQELDGALVRENITPLAKKSKTASNQVSTESQRQPTTQNEPAVRQPSLSNNTSQNLDALTFPQAFKQARKDFGGAGGVFDWRGNQYQTNLKGEAYVANPVAVYGAQTQAEALRLRTAENSTATSAGATVGQSGSETGVTEDGAVVTGQSQPVGQVSNGGVPVTLSTGEELVIFTPQQARAAVTAGLLTQTQANTVIVQLQAKQQTPRPIVQPYRTVGDDG